MNGNRILLDTNAVIALLSGDRQIIDLLKDAKWVGISVVSRIEFMVFPGLTKADEDLFARFLRRAAVVDLSTADSDLIERVIDFRRKYAVKIPDAIIAATATTEHAMLLTADRDFEKIKELTVKGW